MASPVQAGLTMGSVQDRLAGRLDQEERLLAETFPTARLESYFEPEETGLFATVLGDHELPVFDSVDFQRATDEVAQLLRYPEDTAGGIMQVEYMAVSQGTRIDQAIEMIRARSD